tara:strand:- start:98433 stop:99026 length:594 start_codon:yes stop_codon:yes gene_type:complete
MNKKIFLIIIQLFLFLSCGEAVGEGSGTDGISLSQHRIFVSSLSYNGNLGGLDGADSKCQTLATAAGLEREYKAFIGSSATALKNRFNLVGAVYNFNGDERTKIAEIGVDLLNTDQPKDLLANIEYDEQGNSVTDSVWTGSDSEGEISTSVACANWTSSSAGQNGTVGDNSRVTGFYLEDPPNQACSNTYRLYCISI